MMDKSLQPVPIAVAPSETTAHMLKHVLDAQGIESFVLGTHSNLILVWTALAAVHLEVRRQDYEQAREALEAFAERVGVEVPEESFRSHCVVCGYDRAGIDVESLCPECGAEPSLKGLDVGQFRIVGSPGDGSTAFVSITGYAVLLFIAVIFVVMMANLMGYI